MKSRIAVIVLFMVMSVAAYAKAPNLECEKAFDRAFLKNPSISLYTSTHPTSYYRSITVSGDKNMVKQILEWAEIDRKRAFNAIDSSGGEFKRGIVLNIENNECLINIGIKVLDEGSCTMFVEGEPDAFK